MLRKFTTACLTLMFVFSALISQAINLKGKIVDQTTNEPLIGATVMVLNTVIGTTTDIEGNFELKVDKGAVSLEASYISYVTQVVEVDANRQTGDLLIKMAPDTQMISEVTVTVRKNLESEAVLQNERIASNVAIENMGAKEMSLKGLSNVQEGVKKITGISVASAGQIIVRGLGDRYSITTLNGQPIASPNPDNKLIPLNVFPSSAVQNITVSKVYDAESYADYSGAHIDIGTKDQRSEKFFSVGLSVGGNFNTVGRDFYSMNNPSLFVQSSVDPTALSLSKSDYTDYVVQNDIFDTDFSVSKSTALPTFGGDLGYGNEFSIGNQSLSVLATAAISNDQETIKDNIYLVKEATGSTSDSYIYDSYTSELKMAGLLNLGLTLREEDRISYTLFYARNASQEYQERYGDTDNQGFVVSSNSVTHVYTLLTNQLHGFHKLSDSFDIVWDASYTSTSSDEPDRRQIMFTNAPSGDGYILFSDDKQATMRYFGSLEENEYNADLATNIKLGDSHKLNVGVAYKDKVRDYAATRFFYGGLFSIRESVDGYDIYNTSDYINYANIADGTLEIDRLQSPSDEYDAGHTIYAGYASLDLNFENDILLNLGLRYENSKQYVNYFDTAYDRRDLNTMDLFPALNLRYSFIEDQQLRFAASRTVTRPSFIEMAPFLYQESYGSAQIVGNGDLQNGYNYNFDLRYEAFFEKGDMFAATVYYKHLEDPIERVQEKKGGATQQSFMNATDGTAAGVELEFRKTLFNDLKLNLNGSLMYTDVSLSDGGVYTNKERQLQGASPYLFNADISYAPRLGDNKQLSLALLYNLQGPRIHAVGIQSNGDVIQDAVNNLNFVASYQLSKMTTLKFGIDNLLNEEETYHQEIPSTGESVLVESHTPGLSASIGVSLKF